MPSRPPRPCGNTPFISRPRVESRFLLEVLSELRCGRGRQRPPKTGQRCRDIILAKPRAGDVYLLCSDGLTKMLSDELIAGFLPSDPAAAVEELVNAANAHGGKDNISVVVVRIEDPAGANAAA